MNFCGDTPDLQGNLASLPIKLVKTFPVKRYLLGGGSYFSGTEHHVLSHMSGIALLWNLVQFWSYFLLGKLLNGLHLITLFELNQTFELIHNKLILEKHIYHSGNNLKLLTKNMCDRLMATIYFKGVNKLLVR